MFFRFFTWILHTFYIVLYILLHAAVESLRPVGIVAV